MSGTGILTVHRLDALFMFHEHEQCTRRWSMVPFHAIGAGFKKKKKRKRKRKKKRGKCRNYNSYPNAHLWSVWILLILLKIETENTVAK